jgi:hypothetical protein
MESSTWNTCSDIIVHMHTIHNGAAGPEQLGLMGRLRLRHNYCSHD